MAARAIWTGSLKLGSIDLSVKLYSAIQDRSVRFHKSAADISREELRDEQTEQLLKLVKSKEAHNTDVVETEAAEQRPTKVVDLMEVLKKSLQQKHAA